LSYILGDKKSREPILGNLVGNCNSESLVGLKLFLLGNNIEQNRQHN
jgi:hypothetical protein